MGIINTGRVIWLLAFISVGTSYPWFTEDGSKNISHIQLNEELKPVSLDDVLDNKFRQNGFNGIWISEKEFTFRDQDGNFVKYNVESKETMTLIEKAVLVSI